MSNRETDFGPGQIKVPAWIVFAAAVLVILSVMTGSAYAHRVIVFAWIDGNTVHTTSKFPGGNQVSGGTIKVYDGSGNLLLTGKTDDQGKFSFPIPGKSALRIVMSAGPGHQGEWRLSEKEVRTALGDSKPTPPDKARQSGKKSESPKKEADAEMTANQKKEMAAMVEQAVEAALEKKLDKKLDEKFTPVMQILADLENPGPSVNDIFGGIGYILGLFGIAAYVYSRRR